MARGASTFRQRDLTAAVKAMVAAGQKVSRVEVGKDGGFVITLVDPNAKTAKRGDDETPEDLRKLL